MTAPRISVAFQADTMDELYSSVASFLAGRPSVSVGVAVSDQGTLTASVIPAAPVGDTDDDGPANATPPEFDKDGTPWDKRIHAESKAINADGTWRKRRNLSDVTYASVMAEITKTTAGAQPAAAPTIPAAPVAASPAPVGVVDQGQVVIPAAAPAPTAPVVPAATAPAIPAAPAVPAAPVVPAAPAPVAAAAEVTQTAPVAGGMPFAEFMPKIAQAMATGKFDQPTLNGWLAQWQLSDVGQLAADPMKTQQFYDWLKGSNLID